MLAKSLKRWTLGLLCLSHLAASGSVVLLEKINHVECSFPGSTLEGSGSIQTGKDGMAELQSGRASIRIGSNTKLLKKTDGELQIEQGNLLFENLSDRDSLVLMFGGGRLLVTGELGFIQTSGMRGTDKQSVVIGGMAGKTKVVLAGSEYQLGPGEMLSVLPKGEHIECNFNLARQTKDSRLVHGFKSELAGFQRLQQFVRRFAKLESRGFVRSSASQDRSFSGNERMASDSSLQSGSFAAVGTLGQYLTMSALAAATDQRNRAYPAVPPVPGGGHTPVGAFSPPPPGLVVVQPQPANPPVGIVVVVIGAQRGGNDRPMPPLPPVPHAPLAPIIFNQVGDFVTATHIGHDGVGPLLPARR
jgi:hypothetical protein